MKKYLLALFMMGNLALTYGDCTAMNCNVGCGNLSTVEQSFASGMSSMNREMFCNRFTQSMRDSAMGMVGMPDASGNVMTPDQAVEKTARDNNMMPMQSGGTNGCPVK